MVAPKLQEHGHESVPVELPAADDRAGLPQYAATVVDAIGKRDSKRVVLVAQSLAGFTVPLVCEMMWVAMLVLEMRHIATFKPRLDTRTQPDYRWRSPASLVRA